MDFKSNLVKLIGIALLLGTLTFSSIYGLFSYTIKNTEEAERVFVDFIENIKKNEFSAANRALSREFELECDLSNFTILAGTSEEEMCGLDAVRAQSIKVFIEKNSFDQLIFDQSKVFGMEIIPWNNRVRVGDKVTFDGTFKFGSNDNKKDIKVIVEKEDGEWRIRELRLKD